MTPSRFTAILFFLLLTGISGHAQSWQDTVAVLNSIMQRYAANEPGAQVSISRNGQIIYTSARGMANLEYRVPLTTAHKTEAGSVSKQFTAACILILQQQGKLSVADDVRKYVPELRDYGTPIRIQHLLHHTSGLKDWGTIADISGWPRGTKSYDNEDALAIIARQTTLNNPPGDEYIYSNSNYNLQAIIVQRVSGMDLARFSQQYLFEPAGMQHTEWRNNYQKPVYNRATAYNRDQLFYETDMPNENAYGNGGLLTTTEDLLKWNAFCYLHPDAGTGWRAERLKLVPFNNGSRNSYAAGLRLDSLNGWNSIAHSGATAGYRANLEYFPDLGLSIAWLSNSSSRAFSDIPTALRNVFISKLKTAPAEAAKPAPADTSWFSKVNRADYTGRYYSAETQSGAEITLNGQQVGIRPDKGTSGILRPLGKDSFSYTFGQIRFIRNQQGKITGYHISVPRARNVLFVKNAVAR